MTGKELKALGCWGAQDGLLSASELDLLMSHVRIYRPRRLLEIGHYYGLSTAAIALARAEEGAQDWSFLTVDSHEPDPWVPEPAPLVAFLRNRAAWFGECPVEVLVRRSQELVAPLEFDWIFYDGDHGAEQERFTREVLASPEVRWFLFDDRDFPVPARCEELLADAGWRAHSLPLERLPGDKRATRTMTLAVWEREEQ